MVNQGHSTINTSNAAFTDARTHIIPTVNSAQFGSVRITSVSVRPELSLYEGTDIDANKGRKIDIKPSTGEIFKYDDVSQLSIWGIVYTQASGTGFAMEFIGDMHDSSLGGEHISAIPSVMNGCNKAQSHSGCKSVSAGTDDRARSGRGIN